MLLLRLSGGLPLRMAVRQFEALLFQEPPRSAVRAPGAEDRSSHTRCNRGAGRYPAGELKHGPLALVTEHMPVVTIAPNVALIEKLESNMQEVRARGGQLYVFADADSRIASDIGVHVIRMPEHYGPLSPILHVVPQPGGTSRDAACLDLSLLTGWRVRRRRSRIAQSHSARSRRRVHDLKPLLAQGLGEPAVEGKAGAGSVERS
jgi:hypothetical protein